MTVIQAKEQGIRGSQLIIQTFAKPQYPKGDIRRLKDIFKTGKSDE